MVQESLNLPRKEEWPMTGEADHGFRLEMEREEGYRFRVEFDQEGVPELWMDEPPPLGAGEGPNAARLLGAAIGNCLSASLLFCLGRARVQTDGIRTVVEGVLSRNEHGRLRIGKVSVELQPDVEPDQLDRVERCLGLFEDYCIVTQSVRRGIEVDVSVKPVTPAVR